MSGSTVSCVLPTLDVMEAIRGHAQTPQRLVRYPTATYSVQSGRISFAPGTKFDRKLESRVSDRAFTTTMNIRPVQSGDKLRMIRFRPPKATVPSLSQSVTGMDFMDPRYALEYAKWSEIPPWFCRSKSDALVSDRFADDVQNRSRTSVTESTVLPDNPGDQEDNLSDDGIELTSVCSTQSSFPMASKSRDIRPIYRSRDNVRSGTSASFKSGSAPIPHYKPLIGEVYNIRRLYPAHNPWRSLQLESEVNQYIEHKKKCQGRNVRFTDTVDVTKHEPHVVTDRGPIQRPYAKRPSYDERARQSRVAGDLRRNAPVAEVTKQQGRMWDMQAKLKDMLHQRSFTEKRNRTSISSQSTREESDWFEQDSAISEHYNRIRTRARLKARSHYANS